MMKYFVTLIYLCGFYFSCQAMQFDIEIIAADNIEQYTIFRESLLNQVRQACRTVHFTFSDEDFDKKFVRNFEDIERAKNRLAVVFSENDFIASIFYRYSLDHERFEAELLLNLFGYNQDVSQETVLLGMQFLQVYFFQKFGSIKVNCIRPKISNNYLWIIEELGLEKSVFLDQFPQNLQESFEWYSRILSFPGQGFFLSFVDQQNGVDSNIFGWNL